MLSQHKIENQLDNCLLGISTCHANIHVDPRMTCTIVENSRPSSYILDCVVGTRLDVDELMQLATNNE
jgi:hypothetical protein